MVELSCEGDIRFATVFNKSYGGDAFNMAVAANRLGSRVGFVTRLAQDPFSIALKLTLVQEGMDISHLRTVSGFTGQYYVCLHEDGGREFLYYRKGSAASTLNEEDIEPWMFNSAKVVFATGVTLALSQSARRAVRKAFKIARERGVFTAFDPNFRRSLWKSEAEAYDAYNELLPYVDIIMPSIPEDTEPLTGFVRPERVIDFYLFKGIKLVVIKMGAEGCVLGYKKSMEHVPALSVKSVDSTGAGDVFNGAFLHGLADGLSLLDCARLGVAASGLKIRNKGILPGIPHRDAVYAAAFPANSPTESSLEIIQGL